MTQQKESIYPHNKIALVCSGGATKAAAFHMGVCLALKEKGFIFKGGLKRSDKTNNLSDTKNRKEISVYVGSSAGSMISTYLAAGYTVEEIFDAYLQKENNTSPLKAISYANMLSLKASPHEDKDSNLLRKMKGISDYLLNAMVNRKIFTLPGIFTTAGLEQHVRQVIPSNNFADYDPELYIVATQLNHSKRVIFSKEKKPSPLDDPTCIYGTSACISDAVAASTALPPIFSPYGIKNSRGKLIYYFDGEIRETLSTHVAEDADADLIISSYTHQPYHYNREIGSLTKYGIPAIGIQAIYLLVERKIQLARYNRGQKKAALDAVMEYCKSNQFSEKQRRDIGSILEEKLMMRPNVRYIYIHPRASDHQMFFGEHFTLNADFMEKIVQIGFRSAINALLRFDMGNPSS